jgi:ABC-type nitrate/sulfonate/bicarbonate transport system permease component
MTRAIAQFETPRLIAAIVLLSLMGTGLFGLVSVVERIALPWRRYTTIGARSVR